MSILRMFLRAALMALLAVVLPSWASDTLPTSENPATGKWSVMKPSSFKADLLSVIEQCNRAANASSTDRLTTIKCQNLPALIQDGKCQTALVRDGIVFDYMNGHESGRSRVTRNVEKALGQNDDQAKICDLGDRTFAYWFTGERRSCNNIGIVFTALPKKAEGPPTPQPTPGVCGSNARHYGFNETTWPTGGNFCAVGEQSSPSILFPPAGSSTRWSCSGKNGGAPEICDVARDAVPAPPVASGPPPRVCRLVPVSYGTSSTQQFGNTPPGMLMQYCDDTKRWIPGVTSTIGGGEVSTGILVEVCEGGVAK